MYPKFNLRSGLKSELGNYRIETSPLKNESGWSYTKVEVFRDDTRIGGYTRTYSYMYNTFHPFRQRKNGEIREYALISKDYTATAVMDLSSGEIIAEEPVQPWGFCPVDFYVPFEDDEYIDVVEEDGSIKRTISFDEVDGTFGFVAGCFWGDDSTWKVEYLDLSRISEGILERKDLFGYHELPNGISLEDAVDVIYEDGVRVINIAELKRYDMNELLTTGE